MNKELSLPIVAGIFYGLSTIFLKVALPQNFFFFSLFHWKLLFLSPMFWLATFFLLSGLISFFLSLRHTQVTIVIPVLSAFATLIPVIAGTTILKEYISSAQIAAITMILAGAILLRK